jgi:peptide/nickel transport system substrate-binding protein
MKTRRSLILLLSALTALSMVLSACATAATPTPAPQPTAPSAPAAPTSAPAQPVATAPAAPTAAPAQPTAAAPAAAPKPGGQIGWIEVNGYYTLDPFVSPWHSQPQYNVFDTILALKPDLTTYVGDLVDDKWEVTPDNLSVTFHVRPGLKFHDGTAIDAAALKWNLDYWGDPKVAAPNGQWMADNVKEFDAPDASTLTILLKQPYAPLYFQLAQLEIVSPTAYKALGPDKFAQAPVGSGPWKVKEIIPDNSVLYERYDDYKAWPSYFTNRAAAYPDTFLVKYMGDEQVEYASLETGESTILPYLPGQFLDQAKANPDIAIEKGQENGGVYLGFNTQYAPFDNVKVRTAISLAINRDDLIQAGYSGAAVPVYTNLAQSEMGWSADTEAYGKAASDDPAKAKQMLADLGYTAGSDGVLAKDGKKLEFTLTIRTEDEYKRVAEALQSQLADIGVKINIDVKQPQDIKDMTIKGSHQMILWTYGLLDPNILGYLFYSSNIGATNRMRYNNPDLDKLLKEADSALDWNVRKAKIADVLKLLVDQRPNVPLYSRLTYVAYRKDQIAGLMVDPLGGVYFGDAYMLK